MRYWRAATWRATGTRCWGTLEPRPPAPHVLVMDKPITKIVAGGIIFANAVGLAGEVMAVSNYVDTDYDCPEFQATFASTATGGFAVSGIHGVEYATVNVEPLKPSAFKLVELITPPRAPRT